MAKEKTREEVDDDRVVCSVCDWPVIPEQLCKCCVHVCLDCCLTEQKYRYLEEDFPHPNGLSVDEE